MATDAAKRAASHVAAELVQDGMRLGLGTGSTVAHFLDAVAGRRLDVAGVPTSEATAARCRELGIPLLDVADTARLDLAVDGADELTTELALTKGGGGALLREKVVASLADQFVVIATTDKVVDRLGDTFALPIEVVPFAVGPVTRSLRTLGFDAVVERRTAGGGPYRTDNGNAILDARALGGIPDPAVTDVEVALLPGVCETGLFIDLATSALLGAETGKVERLELPVR
jgi:ribose 5-phosphate isomerase A